MKNLSIHEFCEICSKKNFKEYILSSENQPHILRPSFVIKFDSVSVIENQNIVNFRSGGNWIQFNSVEYIKMDTLQGSTLFTIKTQGKPLPIFNLPICTFLAN